MLRTVQITLFAFFFLLISAPVALAEGRAGDSASDPGHVRFGAQGGIGFPRPLAVEGMVAVEKLVLVGAEYSLLPSLTIGSIETSYWALAGDARVFPFKGAFFAGLRAGKQHVGGKATAFDVTESIEVDTIFVNPRVGFLWRLDPGFTIGIDAGVQVPLSYKERRTTVASSTVTDTFGKRVLPTVDLLRIGFLL